MKVYISTSAIENPFDIEKVLGIYSELNIKNIELGSSHNYAENIMDILQKFSDKNFIVHNYFPPPDKAFALNIASFDEEIRSKSIQFAKDAIDLCEKINSPIYSMHAGMLADPHKIEFFDGFSFNKLNGKESDRALAFENLVTSCMEINNYAKTKNVKFAIETSGGHPSKYDLLLMTKISEFEELYTKIDDNNFGILYDIGHYNISTYLYETESHNQFIEKFKDKIFQVHIHHNDGTDDQHLFPTSQELNLLQCLNNNTIIVLEAMNCKIEMILPNLNICESFRKKDKDEPN